MSPTAETPANLTPVEARILGVLIEKEKTTRDAYPLTLNSLTAGCNQKTAREPVLSISESDIQASLEDLRTRILVFETYGASGRVLRYAQNFAKVFGLPPASVALLATLMLRGPQTVSELRANSERLYRFDDASSVEAYLDELAERAAGALTVKLPKQPGAREHRWQHLLCGAPNRPEEQAEQAKHDASAAAGSTNAALAARVSRLEQQVEQLQATVAALAARDPRHPD